MGPGSPSGSQETPLSPAPSSGILLKNTVPVTQDVRASGSLKDCHLPSTIFGGIYMKTRWRARNTFNFFLVRNLVEEHSCASGRVAYVFSAAF